MLTARNFPGESFPALFHVDRASPDPEFGLQESPDRQGLFLVFLRKLDHVELALWRQAFDHLALSRCPDDEAALAVVEQLVPFGNTVLPNIGHVPIELRRAAEHLRQGLRIALAASQLNAFALRLA